MKEEREMLRGKVVEMIVEGEEMIANDRKKTELGKGKYGM